MKRRRLLLILSGCIAAIMLALLVWPREREPEYNGIPLSEWLERFDGGKESIDTNGIWSASTAYHAIEQMGTNSLPFLVRWIQYERPAWRRCLYDASWKLPHDIQYSRTVSRLLAFGDRSRRAEIAVDAFEILGVQARPAIPELRRLAAGYRNKDTASRAIGCLFLLHDDPALEILEKARIR